jgi:hypothetical protein
MGLPDLYPADNLPLERTAWAGGFDIMGWINGVSPDMFAWHKWKLEVYHPLLLHGLWSLETKCSSRSFLEARSCSIGSLLRRICLLTLLVDRRQSS